MISRLTTDLRPEPHGTTFVVPVHPRNALARDPNHGISSVSLSLSDNSFVSSKNDIRSRETQFNHLYSRLIPRQYPFPGPLTPPAILPHPKTTAPPASAPNDPVPATPNSPYASSITPL